MNVYIYFFRLSFPWSSGEKREEKRENRREEGSRGFWEGHGQQERRNIFGRLNEVHK